MLITGFLPVFFGGGFLLVPNSLNCGEGLQIRGSPAPTWGLKTLNLCNNTMPVWLFLSQSHEAVIQSLGWYLYVHDYPALHLVSSCIFYAASTTCCSGLNGHLFIHRTYGLPFSIWAHFVRTFYIHLIMGPLYQSAYEAYNFVFGHFGIFRYISTYMRYLGFF